MLLAVVLLLGARHVIIVQMLIRLLLLLEHVLPLLPAGLLLRHMHCISSLCSCSAALWPGQGQQQQQVCQQSRTAEQQDRQDSQPVLTLPTRQLQVWAPRCVLQMHFAWKGRVFSPWHACERTDNGADVKRCTVAEGSEQQRHGQGPQRWRSVVLSASSRLQLWSL